MSTPALHQRALDYIHKHRLLEAQDHLLVAVSGGPDSVALLHILIAIRQPLHIKQLTVVHFDHQLRGIASAEDHAFVRALAERFDVPMVSGREDVRSYQVEHGLSLEMAARTCRHHFFGEVLEQLKAQKVALGHTADDQAEEVLLRLIRGTGPSGMAGMLPRTRHKIIRPLLFVTRTEVLSYLEEVRLDYCRDQSNSEPVCQRNVLRLEILPALRKHFHPQVSRTLNRYAKLVQDEESFWTEQIDSHWQKLCIQQTASQVTFILQPLIQLHPALLRRFFRSAIERLKGNLLGFYAVHFEALTGWATQACSNGVLPLPQDIWAIKEQDRLIIARENILCSNPFHWIIKEPGIHDFQTVVISLQMRPMPVSGTVPESHHKVWMDADQVKWPLILRSWQSGDRFQPLGLKGTKKLQDFFTDAKVPRFERGKIPLLCDQEKICWVSGYRMDDRVRVSPGTSRVLFAEILNPDL
jgi:tRNA(Ile)-lysidine synthase